jgi:hypothetical protein
MRSPRGHIFVIVPGSALSVLKAYCITTSLKLPARTWSEPKTIAPMLCFFCDSASAVSYPLRPDEGPRSRQVPQFLHIHQASGLLFDIVQRSMRQMLSSNGRRPSERLLSGGLGRRNRLTRPQPFFKLKNSSARS